MPERTPQSAKNFDEVPLGYTPDEAQAEAERCLNCKKPKCVEGCPVRVDIPGLHRPGQPGPSSSGAARKIKDTNCLPAVCGRVCPQETQCEKPSALGQEGDPVADRAAGAFRGRLRTRARPWSSCPHEKPTPTGAGRRDRQPGRPGSPWPGDLILLGHEVTHLRGLSPPRRRAHLRHSRVPAAQVDRRGGGRLPVRPGRAGRAEPGRSGKSDQRRRVAGREGLRRGVRRRRERPAHVRWAFPARTSAASTRPTST